MALRCAVCTLLSCWPQAPGKVLRSTSLPEQAQLPDLQCVPAGRLCKQRLLAHKAGADSQLGPGMLFFGCRRRDQDFLYGSLLEAWHEQGAVELQTAFSRQQVQPCLSIRTSGSGAPALRCIGHPLTRTGA